MSRILRREGVRGEIAERRLWVSNYWRRFPSVKRFVADWFRAEWEAIQRCRFEYRVYESKDNPGKFKVTPKCCWKVPFCLTCTKVRASRRTLGALDRFSRATPKGQPMQFVHIVLSAPLTEDGQGWGAKAHQDIPKFAKVTRRVLEDIYGEGLGGVMSYQDFGERPFHKIHPHMDLTLAARRLVDGKMMALRPLNLKVERATIDAHTANRARAFQIDARKGDIDFSRVIHGAQEYYPVLKYQMRELFDLRKVEYKRREGKVEWKNYKDVRREAYRADEFVTGFESYARRLGLYGYEGTPVELHRYSGYMSKGSLRETEAMVEGSSIPHGRGCPCSECEDWELRFDDDFGQQAEAILVA